MTFTDILLLTNVVVMTAVAVWQRARIAALETTRPTVEVSRAIAKVAAQDAVAAIAARQAAVDEAVGKLPKILKGFCTAERMTKLENSIDTRVNDAVLAAMKPGDATHRVCSRCNRLVARSEYFPDSDTTICANCNYKAEHK